MFTAGNLAPALYGSWHVWVAKKIFIGWINMGVIMENLHSTALKRE